MLKAVHPQKAGFAHVKGMDTGVDSQRAVPSIDIIQNQQSRSAHCTASGFDLDD